MSAAGGAPVPVSTGSGCPSGPVTTGGGAGFFLLRDFLGAELLEVTKNIIDTISNCFTINLNLKELF